jgi:hypothetical protein
MKLYTEEQVRQIASTICLGRFDFNDTPDDLVNELIPIELPSDEEIEKEAKDIYPINLGGDMWMANRDETNKGYKQEGFTEGAKWVIEKIKQQAIT